MTYIDSVKVMFEDKDFQEFLEIRNWPRSFNKWIQIRKQQLIEQKEKLITEMRQETNMVFEKIIEFKSQIKKVLEKGLIKLPEKEREARKVMLEELFYKLGPENVAKPETAGNNSDRSDRDTTVKEKT